MPPSKVMCIHSCEADMVWSNYESRDSICISRFSNVSRFKRSVDALIECWCPGRVLVPWSSVDALVECWCSGRVVMPWSRVGGLVQCWCPARVLMPLSSVDALVECWCPDRVLVGANLSVKSLNLASCECNEGLSRNISICRCLNQTDEFTTHSCPVLSAPDLPSYKMQTPYRRGNILNWRN